MSTNDALLNRIAKVERELRFWRIGGTLAAVCIGLSMTVAAKSKPETPSVIQAREFQLLGDDGAVRASLKTLGNSNTQLRLYDGSGKSEVAIIANEQRAIMQLTNDNQINSASIEAYARGGDVALSRQTGDGKALTQIVGGMEGSYVTLHPLKGDETRIPAKKKVEVSCSDEDRDSDNIEVTVGEEFTLSLCSNNTTGYGWSNPADINNIAVIKQVDHRYIQPSFENGPPPKGAPGNEVWDFKAIGKGQSTVSLKYSQPREGGEKAAQTFVLTVHVQ